MTKFRIISKNQHGFISKDPLKQHQTKSSGRSKCFLKRIAIPRHWSINLQSYQTKSLIACSQKLNKNTMKIRSRVTIFYKNMLYTFSRIFITKNQPSVCDIKYSFIILWRSYFSSQNVTYVILYNLYSFYNIENIQVRELTLI